MADTTTHHRTGLAGRTALSDNIPSWRRAQKRTIERVVAARWMVMFPELTGFSTSRRLFGRKG